MRALALALLLAGCGHKPELRLPPEGAILPVSESGKLKATLPDGRILELWPDSGASLSSISQDTAREFKLPTQGCCLPNPTLLVDRVEWFRGSTLLPPLSLGEAEVRGLQADVSKAHETTLLGQDVLSQCVLYWSQETAELRLLPSEDLEDRLKALDPGRRWTPLPCRRHFGCLFLTLPLKDGGRLEFLVDTGAPVTLLTPETVEDLRLKPASYRKAMEALGFKNVKDDTGEIRVGPEGYDGKPAQPHWLVGLDIAGKARALVVFEVSTPLSFNVLGLDQLGRTPFVVDGPADTLWIAETKP